MASLKALSVAFPKLPVTIFTESLGGSEQRLRDGVAQFAIAPMPLTGGGDLAADFLADFAWRRSSSVDHPLASAPAPISRGDARALCPAGAHRPHAADPALQRRHRQPSHLALRRSFDSARIPARRFRLVQHAGAYGADHIAAGRLKRLKTAEQRPFPIPRPCRAGARQRNRPRRALADRRLRACSRSARKPIAPPPPSELTFPRPRRPLTGSIPHGLSYRR